MPTSKMQTKRQTAIAHYPFVQWAGVAVLVLSMPSVQAATIKVDGTNCTLTDAIVAANTDAAKGNCTAGNEADTLKLTARTYTLAAINNTTNAPNGLPAVTSVITLDGKPGGSAIIRSSAAGTPEFRLIYVASTGNLTLNHVAVRNGKLIAPAPWPYILGFNGAGIYNAGGKVTLNASITSHNRVGGKVGNSFTISSGGGIYNSAGKVILNNSRVSNNRAIYGSGGGIRNNGGSVTLNHSTALGNSVGGDTGNVVINPAGGGIASTDGKVTLNSSFVSDNHADSSGGGIFTYGGSVTLNNSTVSHNDSGYAGEIITHPGFGGGIDSFNGSVILNNSTVSENHADYFGFGGGISNNGGSVTVNNSTVSNNRVGLNDGTTIYTGHGSGIHTFGGSVTLNSSTVSENRNDYGFSAGIEGEVRQDGTPANLTLINSIIANSIGGGDCKFEGLIVFTGKNLIEDGSCGVAMHGGLSGDPKLGLLLDNGGVTKTHALLANSMAIGAADDNATPVNSRDQRGANRPQGVHRDIGAFEKILTAEAKVRPLLDYFSQQVQSGGLVGTGSTVGLKKEQQVATRNQLLLASDQIRWGLNSKACGQLAKTMIRIDPDQSPDNNDYVTGAAGSNLVAMLANLRIELSCP